jgi:hypothetical protein
MKRTATNWIPILTIVLGAMLTKPGPVHCVSLGLVQQTTYSSEIQVGEPITIQAIEGIVGFDIIGPGGLLTGITVDGTTVTAKASSSGFLSVSPIQFWDYGTTETAMQRFWWGAIYQLNGSPGETANISVGYTYYNSWFDLGIDGRTQSSSYAGFFTAIVPQSQIGAYGSLSDNLGFWASYLQCATNQPTLSFDKNFHGASGANDEQTQTGSIPLGTLHVGDQLHFFGTYYAKTEVQAYFAGVNIATMVSTLDLSLTSTASPVPEPAAVFLMGLGLLSVVRLRKGPTK